MSCKTGSAVDICHQQGSTGLAKGLASIPTAYQGLAEVVRSYAGLVEFQQALAQAVQDCFTEYDQFMTYGVNEWLQGREVPHTRIMEGARIRSRLADGIRRFLRIQDEPITHDLWALCEQAISDEIQPYYRKPPAIAAHIIAHMPTLPRNLLLSAGCWGGLSPDEHLCLKAAQALERGERVPADILVRFPELVAEYGFDGI